MADHVYKALIVDDEAAVRSLTICAMNQEGFSCDAAADGVEAKTMVDSHDYDVVVTDLQMPNRHGHALAAELLLSENRPLIVILTGVLARRLAKDLILRGADSIEFKPVNHGLFAAKVKALIDRRRQRLQSENVDRVECNGANPGNPEPGLSEIEAKLAHLSKILPVSQTAFDVFSMTSLDSFQPSQIAAAIACDASLSIDVLRLANSSFCNPSGRKVIELDEAVVRVGQKRIGELALATSTLAAVTANALPGSMLI